MDRVDPAADETNLGHRRAGGREGGVQNDTRKALSDFVRRWMKNATANMETMRSEAKQAATMICHVSP